MKNIEIKNIVLKPVVFYSDLALNKKVIFKDNRDKTGVYRWNNLITGAFYVGSAVDLTRRLRDYFSPNFLNKEIIKNNSIIYRAILKYGYKNFSLDILEYCEKDNVLIREQYYIDLLKPKYNICNKAGSSLGRVIREETYLKLRKIRLNRLFLNSNCDTLGEFLISYIDEKLNESRIRIDKLYKKFNEIRSLNESKVSLNTRMKILISIKTKQAVLVTDVSTGVTNKYLSARRAAEALNASSSTIMNKMHGRNKSLYKGKYLIRKQSSFDSDFF